jgi:hypothetical protein
MKKWRFCVGLYRDFRVIALLPIAVVEDKIAKAESALVLQSVNVGDFHGCTETVGQTARSWGKKNIATEIKLNARDSLVLSKRQDKRPSAAKATGASRITTYIKGLW